MGQPSKEAIARYRSKPEVKEHYLQKQRERRAANPEKNREAHRKSERRRKFRRYGITEEQYLQMLKDQNQSCAICKTTCSGTRDWHIDHCHDKGHVRGVLCSHCNLMLGHARDRTDILIEAIKYLQERG